MLLKLLSLYLVAVFLTYPSNILAASEDLTIAALLGQLSDSDPSEELRSSIVRHLHRAIKNADDEFITSMFAYPERDENPKGESEKFIRAIVKEHSKEGLCAAITENNTRLLAVLLKNGADPNTLCDGIPLVEVAYESNSIDLIRILMAEEDLYINIETTYGKSLLELALEDNNWEVIELLLTRKDLAEFEDLLPTLLIRASKKGRTRVVEQLLKDRSSIDSDWQDEDIKWDTGLSEALENGRWEIVKAFFQKRELGTFRPTWDDFWTSINDQAALDAIGTMINSRKLEVYHSDLYNLLIKDIETPEKMQVLELIMENSHKLVGLNEERFDAENWKQILLNFLASNNFLAAGLLLRYGANFETFVTWLGSTEVDAIKSFFNSTLHIPTVDPNSDPHLIGKGLAKIFAAHDLCSLDDTKEAAQGFIKVFYQARLYLTSQQLDANNQPLVPEIPDNVKKVFALIFKPCDRGVLATKFELIMAFVKGPHAFETLLERKLSWINGYADPYRWAFSPAMLTNPMVFSMIITSEYLSEQSDSIIKSGNEDSKAEDKDNKILAEVADENIESIKIDVEGSENPNHQPRKGIKRRYQKGAEDEGKEPSMKRPKPDQ